MPRIEFHFHEFAGAWNAVTSVVSGVDPSFTGVGIFEWLVEMAPHPVRTGS